MNFGGYKIDITPLGGIGPWEASDWGLQSPAPGMYARFDVTEVPEPTTMIAGALLLLPFGASTLRMLRKNRKA